MDLDKVRSIAEKARKWAERYVKRKPGYGYDEDLACLCAIASAYLCHQLQKNGVKAKIAENDSHCFIKIGDYAVDITATQFNDSQRAFAPVEIRPLAEMQVYDREWWRVQFVHKSAADLREHLIKRGWPQEQVPHFNLAVDRRS